MESMSTLLDALQALHDYYARQHHLQESVASYASKSESSSSSEEEEEEYNEEKYEEDEEKNEDKDDEDKDEEKINVQCCPGCGATVPKRFDGCTHMICWCQCEFCYKCGERWNEDHFDSCEENNSD